MNILNGFISTQMMKEKMCVHINISFHPILFNPFYHHHSYDISDSSGK